MLKLWGRLTSINVQKAVWCLDELGLPFERVEAGGAFGVTRTPEYLAMNPNALVPTLDDDGFILWESNAIVRYLAAKHPEGGLFPTDLRVRADAERWMDWQATNATPALRDGFWHLIRTAPESRDHAAIKRSLEASEASARILDARLADRPYVAGDAFGVGDIATGAHAHRWLNMPIDRPSLPNLEGWYGRLRSRPAAQQVLTLPVS